MLCCIFNYAPHYRFPIYSKLANEFDVHFYFGERLRNETIMKIDFSELSGFKKEFKVKFFSTPFAWEWQFGMIKLALNRKYDTYLITPNIIAPSFWIFIILGRFLGKKIYSWEHGITNNNLRPILLKFHKVIHQLTSGSFIYGERAKKIMIGMGYDENKLHIIYNSLNYDLNLKFRRGLTDERIYRDHFKNDDPILLFIGRLTKQKKLELLIEAHAILFNNGLPLNVILIGEGTEKTELAQRVGLYGLEGRYWFFGSLYDEKEIARLLFNATICISPGNVGLTAIHALSYGLPVITNDNYESQMPEYEAIIDNETGLFFKDGDVYALAAKIEYWLKENYNRDLVRARCYKSIDTTYNPNNQMDIFRKVICSS